MLEKDITNPDSQNTVYESENNLSLNVGDIKIKNNEDLKKSKKSKKDKKDKKSEKEEVYKVSYLQLFKYSSGKEKCKTILAIILSVISGLTMPMMIECFGTALTGMFGLVLTVSLKSITGIDDDGTLEDLYNTFVANTTEAFKQFSEHHPNVDLDKISQNFQSMSSESDYSASDLSTLNFMTHDEIWHDLNKSIIYLLLIALLSLICSSLYSILFTNSASAQSSHIRSLTFQAILRQEIEWHEKTSPGELSSRIISDTILIEDGMSIKLGFLIEHMVIFVGGYALAFYYGWLLSLEMSSVVPLIIVIAMIMGVLTSKFTEKSQKAYGEIGGIAQEAFSQIRTIVSFGTEEKEIERYNEKLKPTKKYGIILANTVGICLGLLFFIVYASEGIAYGSGSKMIDSGDMTSEEVFKVLMNILFGTIMIASVGSVTDAFGKATGAASKLFEIIDRKPKIDKFSGIKPASPLIGNIEFKNVRFNYPSRPNVEVLKGISFNCHPGQTIALVGASGSGKSTIVQLLERFYDFKDGEILVDGTSIRDYNIQWLRSQIGLVSQEPTLFDLTIGENIAITNPNATQEDIERAAKLANAHEFIVKLTNGYKTSTGERGLQLSGGQKQRICIARALINNPKILLLDEATSALDNTSEKIVQAALDTAAEGRTTFIIAHRLTTIRNADRIIVMNKGTIVESGNHDELMNLNGVYYNLIKDQEMKISKEIVDSESSSDEQEENEDVNVNKHFTVDSVNKHFTSGSVNRKASEMNRMRTYLSGTSIDIDGTNNEDKPAKKTSLREMMSLDWKRFFEFNKPYWVTNLMGYTGSILAGSLQPSYAFIFASAMDVFNKRGEELIDGGKFWAWMFVLIGAANFVLFYLQTGGFSMAGESLTYHLRSEMYRSIIHKEVGFFDTSDIGDGSEGASANMSGETDHRSSTGTLTSKLATDAALVQSLNFNIGTVVQQIVTLIMGYIIAFACSWKLTLIILVVMPLIFIGEYYVLKMNGEKTESLRKAYENSSKVACEAIVSVKTVYSLNLEDHFIKTYDEELNKPEANLMRKSLISGIGYGVGNSSAYLIYVIGIYFGCKFMETDGLEFNNLFRTIMSIAFTSTAAGQINTIAPNILKAIDAFKRVLEILDREPKIDSEDPNGMIKRAEEFEGSISFNNIRFRYPSRPNVTVVRLGHQKIEIPKGKMCAIVGGSGCGKSTLIGLIPRWYDVAHGSVCVDNVNNKNYNIKWLRKQIGIVNQEPCLFNISIKENIKYGKLDATDEEVYEAARKANIHKFIMSLPEGYETKVGNLGTAQMSGGQKQRIAIARAIVRNPNILLLDEATSALDAESELLVQQALEEVSQGRTTITIAHRLSTIKNADIIVVMKDGRIAEMGTHEELLEKKSEYYNMVLAGDGIVAKKNN